MKRTNALSAAGALLILFYAAARAEDMNPALKGLVAAADKEGALTLTWSPSTYDGARGAAVFQAAMNRMFGSKVQINFVPGADMARIGNQLATEYAAGQKADADIMLGAAPQMATLIKLDLFAPVDWRSYLPSRIGPAMTEFDGKLIRVATGIDRRNLQFEPSADDSRRRSTISSNRSGRERSPRRPMRPASMCCWQATSGARTGPSPMFGRFRNRSPASFAAAKPNALPPANTLRW